MTRQLFGGSSDDYVVDSSGRPVINRRIRFYTTAQATTEITDLATDVAGTGTPLTVTSNTAGFWGPVYGPDGVSVMYAGAVDSSGNPPTYVVAVYTHTQIGAVASVNGHTGTVVLAASDVGADAVGAAAAVLATSAQKSANLSDVANAATARTNLGLGTAATQPTSAFDAAGAAAGVQTNLTAEIARATAAESAITAGMQFKTAVVVATTNQALSGLLTIDGVTLTDGQIALLTGQSAGSGNGLWAVHSGAWTRPPNFAAGADASGTSVFVEGGSTGALSTYVVSGTTNNVIGTNVLTFVKTSSSGTSSLAPTAVKTVAYTAVAGDLAMMNVPGGATALTLPTAPADKTQVGYRAIGATVSLPLTVTAGGSDTIGTAGATTATVPFADEVVVLQYQASGTRWLAVSNVKTQSSLDTRYKTPVSTRSPLVAKTRGTLVIPNTWTNTAQKAYPENALWDPDLNLYVGVYMAEQQTPSAFSQVCYWTAPSLAAIKAGQLTDGGIVSGMSGGAQTPHLMREGAFWYIFAANTGVSNIDIWRSTTSPAGAGAYSKVQTGIITRGAVASISTPAAPTVTPTTGVPGTIAAGTGSYKVSALTAAGETTAGNAGSGTLASSGFYTVSWSAITGATGYNIYKQTAPGTLYLLVGTVSGNATTSYQDNTGTPVSAQQPMLSNVSASFDLTFALEQYVVRIPTRDPLWAQGYRYAMYYMGQSTATSPEQVGVAVSATLNATGWTKLNSGNPLIAASGGYANDSEGSADPFVWFAPNGKIIVFYVAIEAGGVGKTMHWHPAAAIADQISGPYTKLGTVIETPCYPDVGQGGSATWSTGTYPRMAQMNGNEGGVWRGAFLRNDIDNEVIWMHAGKNMTGVSNTTTTVAGFLDTYDLASPLLRGIVAVEPWERVEIESGDPRWVLTGTWTNQSTSEWSGGTMKFSTTTNDTATFHFEGIGVRVGLGAMNNMGIVEIWLDGVYDRTLDLYNPGATFHSPVTYEKLGLTPGAHKVMVKIIGKNTVSSNSVVVVDYAEALGSGVGL